MLKALACALVVLGSVINLQADDNWLQNGAFTEGITHWRGNGRSPADFASDNPLNASDPLTSKGLIIPLRHTTWDTVAQDFRGKGTSGVLTITYMESPDTVFSTKAEDYDNIPRKINYNSWAPFPTPLGTWVVFLSDLNSSSGTYYHIMPKGKPGTPQTVRLNVARLTAFDSKTLLIAVPPGEGKLIFLKITLNSGKGGQAGDGAYNE